VLSSLGVGVNRAFRALHDCTSLSLPEDQLIEFVARLFAKTPDAVWGDLRAQRNFDRMEKAKHRHLIIYEGEDSS